jgi:uncharacterized protein
MRELDLTQSAALIAELRAQYQRQGTACTVFETHISHVLLIGDDAYKFKKPVNLGFLDFTTRALRRHYCEREVALNHRYAPRLYRGVVGLVRGPHGLAFDTVGDPLDYAVWMRRFADGERLDELLESLAVGPDDFSELGRTLGEMHLHAPRPPMDKHYGNLDLACSQMLEGIEPLRSVNTTAAAVIDRYQAAVTANIGYVAGRPRDGFIRDCHGDLHLSNLVRLDGRLVPFDCIEFNDDLRFIDTLSDFAFLKMDLDLREAQACSNALLNAYLAACGDYAGLGLLRLYCAYRSIVRAKVARLASNTTDPALSSAALARSARHIALAAGYLAPPPSPSLLITYGVSGSGKSWRSQRVATERGYIHLRSDVERRRSDTSEPRVPSDNTLNAGRYSETQTEKTYLHLKSLARVILRAGYSVIVDATFLKARQRAMFRELGDEINGRFGILACDAPEAVLRARIETRRVQGGDPSEATQEVLTQQLANREPLGTDEQLEISDLLPKG